MVAFAIVVACGMSHALVNPYVQEYGLDYTVCHEELPQQMMYGECVPNGCWEELPRKMTSGDGPVTLFVKYPDGTRCLGGPGRCYNGTCIRSYLFNMFDASPKHEVHKEEAYPLADRVNTTLPYCGHLNEAVVPSKVLCSLGYPFKTIWNDHTLSCVDVKEGICEDEDEDDDEFCLCGTIDAMECTGRPPATAVRFSHTSRALESLESDCYRSKEAMKRLPCYNDDDDNDDDIVANCCDGSF